MMKNERKRIYDTISTIDNKVNKKVFDSISVSDNVLREIGDVTGELSQVEMAYANVKFQIKVVIDYAHLNQ